MQDVPDRQHTSPDCKSLRFTGHHELSVRNVHILQQIHKCTGDVIPRSPVSDTYSNTKSFPSTSCWEGLSWKTPSYFSTTI